jgi:hypothetical protein
MLTCRSNLGGSDQNIGWAWTAAFDETYGGLGILRGLEEYDLMSMPDPET